MSRESIIVSVAERELKRRERRAAVWGFVAGCICTILLAFIALTMD